MASQEFTTVDCTKNMSSSGKSMQDETVIFLNLDKLVHISSSSL